MQELTAATSLGVPEYLVQESGPDHRKQFTAIVRVNGADYGDGHGRSKKEAEQQAAESAWTAIRAGWPASTGSPTPLPRRTQRSARGCHGASATLMPELPEVEVVRRGLERWVVGRRIADGRGAHPRAIRRHVAGADDFAALLVGRRVEAARRRGKYLWLPLDSGDAVLAHLGMSGQLLVEPPIPPTRRTCGYA